ncbi:MAG: response regulator [Clostridia bacterium]|nr:response regulator [Clostridia bacterium]
MIGMIIADDELIIRQGLMSIPWNEYGIEVLGAASNGEEALSMVQSIHPQILLTDIRMPGLDGLALIEAVKKVIPEIKTILLTGYQDFNYARTALQLGAMGYVLKPSDPDEITEIVLKAKTQIEEEMREKLENEWFRQQADTAKSALVNSFMLDLLYGRITDTEQISRNCLEYNHPLENYAILLAEFDAGSNLPNSELACKIVEEISNMMSVNHESVVLQINPSTCCVIYEMPKDAVSVKEQLLSEAMEIRNRIKSKFDIYISVGISKNSTYPADMHALFNQTVNCLKMRFSLGKGAIIHVEDLKDSLKRHNLETLKVTDEILENIKNGNYRLVEKMSRELLFRLSREQNADEQTLKSVCFDILVSAYRILKEDKTADHGAINEQLLLSKLVACTDVEELEECMINMLMNILDLICSKVPAARNKVITDIIEYIEKYYMEEISLFTLSEHVHMNHIYISRLIKRETGETFLDILTKTRMKKACELLSKSDHKTYEIAFMVGIKDSGYFSQVFKKFYGRTPSEYREDLLERARNTNEAKL